MSNEKSVFETLSAVEVHNKVRQKGTSNNIFYISWSNAVRELLKAYPTAIWEFTDFGSEGGRMPYLQTESGCFVECTVTVKGISRTQMLPVLNHVNKAVPSPDAMQVNKAQMRCLTKAIALHGFGLELWAGEDLDRASDEAEQQAEPEKEASPISDDGLTKAIEKIQSGELTVDRLMQNRSLTDKQITLMNQYLEASK